MEDSEDTESDVNTFIVSVPELPPAVPTGKITLERMPDINEQTAVVMGSVRMKPSMKFPITLGAAATLQVDATTSCDTIQDQVVLRLEGPRNGCSVDPYIKLLAGDEIIANDDDSGAVQYPMGTDEDGFEVFDVYNSLSSRLSAMLEPGEYLIEATSYSDIFKDDVERDKASDVEYDLWITIITTPAEAERLMKNNIVGSSTNTTTELTVNVIPDPAKNDVIPADLQPAQSNNLPAPVQNSGSPVPNSESPVQNSESATESSGSVVSLTVEAGTGKVNVTPQTLGGGAKTSVTVKAKPGGRECTTTSGDTCSINKLSPWISYTLTANVTGSQNLFTTTAKPTLQWKAGAKVKVSSLGLSAAAKAMGLTLKKGGTRVSRNCTINAARTVITVGKSGSCWVTSRTTQTSKPKQSGPPLTATVTIK
jgi:hypothetical protein